MTYLLCNTGLFYVYVCLETHPTPTSLIQAYVEAERVSLQSPATASGAPNYFGNDNTLNQEVLNYTPTMNPIPIPNQLVLHPRAPMSQAMPTQPAYLQDTTTSTRTQEEKDEMKDLIEQVKKLSTEVTYLRNQDNQLQNAQRNYQ